MAASITSPIFLPSHFLPPYTNHYADGRSYYKKSRPIPRAGYERAAVLKKFENNLANQGSLSKRKEALADAIADLKRQIASDSAHCQIESMLAELETQQSRETAELASFRGSLALDRVQTLPTDILSEIFLQCGVPSVQDLDWGPPDVEMQTKVDILQVCSSWRAAALNTPTLWHELHYVDTGTLPLELYYAWLRRAAAVPLDLNTAFPTSSHGFEALPTFLTMSRSTGPSAEMSNSIWPILAGGDDGYWAGVVELLHTHCRALGTLHLKLPTEDSIISLPSLFAHPHQPANLRNLTVHSYDDRIHSTLSNIPWIQLSRLEFRVQHDYRFISPTQLASILSQTPHLTHLVANLGPDGRSGPSAARVLPLLELQTLEVSWVDPEGYFEGIAPDSFIDLCDKLFVPLLKSLTITTGENANPFVLPALTSLTARCEFPLESLHIWSFVPLRASPVDTLVGLLRDLPTLTSLHWLTSWSDVPGLVEALTYTADGGHTLLPDLVDISLELNSYDGLLPAFADMVTSRLASTSSSLTVTSLRQFNLKTTLYGMNLEQDVEEKGPFLISASKTANEDALSCLDELLKTNTVLRGSLQFQHLDQRLTLAERSPSVHRGILRMQRLDGDNFLYCDDDLVWRWVDSQTQYNLQGQLYF
ncbi:hypothetical protein C8R45DRAFT_1184940 [Mycena sanguinolenta]|nr:hypothetical protein C8R45DRAFT_1184940 [Mycena sanguinolenta]